jgi:hypothetical protein
MGPMARMAVGREMTRPQSRKAGEAVDCELVDPGAKVLTTARQGKAATSDTPACNDRAQTSGNVSHIGQGVGENHDEAQRTPA